MELRIAHARATRDIDLNFVRHVKNESELVSNLILNDLRDLAEQDLNDHFIYQVGEAQIDLENAPYGGARYPVSALMVLLLNIKTPEADNMLCTLHKVFKKRDTHPLPQILAPPPAQWDVQFIEMAAECGLSQNMQENFEKISEFYNQIIDV